MRPRTLAAALANVAIAATALSGCGSSPAPAATTPGLRSLPNIHAFLRQPVATPSVCATIPASSDGRKSPWAGTVDVSIFFKLSASTTAIHQVGALLQRASIVQRTYFESRAEAYEEFQRLYTCWSEVPSSQTPPSYRVVLLPTATIRQRDALVARLLHDPGVDSASCDPALPCTDVVRSAQPR